MKKLLFTAFVILIAMSCHSGEKQAENDVEGAWSFVERAGMQLPDGMYTVKMITGDRFLWYTCDKEGNIMNGAGGKYTYENGVYTEYITDVLPSMERFKGKQGVYNLTLDGKKMTISGKLNGNIQVDEIWEKAE